MRRTLLFLSTVLLALTVTSPAWASQPIREIHPDQGEVVIRHQCDFPVLGEIDGPEILTTFVDADGNPVKGIAVFPGNKITFTNLESGTSLTVMGTGSSQLRALSDGSTSARAMGHGPFFPNPLTGEPGIWYLSGQGAAIIGPDGNLVSGDLMGRLVDLCPQLA